MKHAWKLALLAFALPWLACAQDRAPRDIADGAPVAAAAAPKAAPPFPELEVIYLANEGFLIRGGQQQVLVDALFGAGIAGYDAVPANLRDRIERGTAWGAVEVALATHFHGDHFDPAAVERFLAANPEAIFISTPQAAASFRQAHAGADVLAKR